MFPAVVRWGFYHDCSEDDAARAAARLCSQPARVFQMTFELAPDRFGRVPRHYVECLQDHAIDLLLQRAMVQATPCTIHTLDASHSPFYSMPDQLAAVLEETARTG